MTIHKLKFADTNYLNLARQVFSTLTPREERIFRLRLEGYTLEEVGSKFGLTRQRIHQIEPKIHRKLKHPARSYKIRRIIKLADKDIWQRLLKQQHLKTKKNLVDRRTGKLSFHWASNDKNIDPKKGNFFINCKRKERL